MSKPTPRPWVAPKDQLNLVTTERAWNSTQVGELGRSFQAIVSLKEGEEQARADAAHIVKCVNMHDELIAALKGIATHLGSEDAAQLLDLIAKAEAE